MNALEDEETDLVLYSQFDGKPAKCFDDENDVVVFSRSHQDPCSSVLDGSELLDALARSH